uniref:Uncharacterized protein n=1 Tax=Candidatus Kentrum sp. SD TaxID=2126332 RepID=A0A451BIQ4_9GAMM|nr:MAG: hypothetical protein BECKSD772D_GA0070982_100845 [Candidatus Kentron sp. SD]
MNAIVGIRTNSDMPNVIVDRSNLPNMYDSNYDFVIKNIIDLQKDMGKIAATVDLLKDSLEKQEKRTAERFDKLDDKIAEDLEKQNQKIAEGFEEQDRRIAEGFERQDRKIDERFEKQDREIAERFRKNEDKSERAFERLENKITEGFEKQNQRIFALEKKMYAAGAILVAIVSLIGLAMKIPWNLISG